MSSPIVSLKHVSIERKGGLICPKDASVDLYPGEMVLLEGGNGAGKSTLLKILSLAETPTSGQRIFLGTDIDNLSHSQVDALRRRIEYIPQKDFGLIGGSAFYNVVTRLQDIGKSRKDAQSLARNALTQVQTDKGFDIYTDVSTLSGGEQARVAIASALACQSPLCLADEIFADLSKDSYQPLMLLFQKLAQNGTCMVMVSHIPGFEKYFGRIITLENGEIVSDVITFTHAVAMTVPSYPKPLPVKRKQKRRSRSLATLSLIILTVIMIATSTIFTFAQRSDSPNVTKSKASVYPTTTVATKRPVVTVTATPKTKPTHSVNPHTTQTVTVVPSGNGQPPVTQPTPPTRTPTIANEVFDNFNSGISSWGIIGGDVTYASVNGNGFMRFTPPSGGAAEAYRDVDYPALKDYRGISLRINLNGTTLLSGDASAFYINVNSVWNYVSLSSYVRNGLDGWQSVYIPLTDFSGFDKNSSFISLGFRFWLPNTGTIDIDDIIFIA